MKRTFSKAFNLAIILRSSSFIAFIAFTASCGGGESTPKASVAPVAPVAPATLVLSSFTDVSYTEGTAIGSVTLNVELNRAVVAGENVTFDYATSDGTATASEDYTAKSATETILAGARTASITVPITNDSIEEVNKDFTVTLTPTGFTAGSTGSTDLTATITIVDDDTAPIPLELASFSDISYTEGTAIGSATLTVELNRAVIAGDGTVTFNYATSDGTAKSGSDYTYTLGTKPIGEGASTASITVPITNDSIEEVNKDFTVTLSDLVGFTAGSTDLIATITIIDDETVPMLSSFSDISYTEGTGGDAVTLTVELNRDVVAGDGTVTFDYATSDGTAKAGSDYTYTSGTETIVAGASTASITVPITNDSIEEVNKDFTVTLSDLNGFTADSTDLIATITIVDDDTAPIPLELSSFADVSPAEGTGNATLTVELNRAVVAGETVTFDYATSDGTAMAGSDYTAKSDTVTFVAGASTASITVPITNDSIEEVDKDFTVTLSDLNGFTAGSTDLIATITIVDDDTAPDTLELSSFSNVPYTEGTGGDAVTLTVVLNRDVLATDGTVTFEYTTVDGTAKAGSDYTASSGTKTIGEGARSASIVVATGNDDAYEIDEEFTVTLSNLVGFTEGSTDLTATITIADNDSAPMLSSFADVSPAEGTGNVTLTVELNRAVVAGETVTFDYATSDGTAIAGSDYTAKSDTVTFVEGASTASITVLITNDGIEEVDKDFTVTLSDLNGFTADSADLTATITIIDDDAFMIKSFADVEVYEVKAGTNFATLDVELSRAVATGETVSFTYSTDAIGSNPATAGSDYIAVIGGSVSIAEGESVATITITINGDDEDSESDETFSVTIVPTGFDATSDADSDATATVTINDYNVDFSDTDSDTVKDADDIDYDGDGLIEIRSASEFDNIRYDLAGASYDDEEDDGAGNGGTQEGCGNGGTVPACIGYEMEEDIDLSTIITLETIGNIGEILTGIFEGNGNTLSGVSIVNDTLYTGLFAVVSGTIRNLAVTGEVTSNYVGGFLTPGYLGAVVGYLAPSGVLNNVSANVPVSATAGGYQWIGGLVGGNKGKIEDSSATGAVITSGNGVSNVGGLVGNSSGDIISSYATGSVTGGSGGKYLGGLVGQVSGSDVINSYATGNVTGGIGFDEVGGLVGRTQGSSNILNSFAYSTSTTSKIDGGAGNDYVGGLVGYKDGSSKVENCYAISELIQGGTGIDYVGGLIGIDQSTSSISYNYAVATVTGNNGAFADGEIDTVGRLWGGGISTTNISNYYLDTSDYGLSNPSNVDNVFQTLPAEAKEIDDETDFEAITAASSETDFGEDKGFSEINWDLTDGNGKYPSLKSYKVENGAQVEGDLICGQPDTNVQCTTQ